MQVVHPLLGSSITLKIFQYLPEGLLIHTGNLLEEKSGAEGGIRTPEWVHHAGYLAGRSLVSGPRLEAGALPLRQTQQDGEFLGDLSNVPRSKKKIS